MKHLLVLILIARVQIEIYASLETAIQAAQSWIDLNVTQSNLWTVDDAKFSKNNSAPYFIDGETKKFSLQRTYLFKNGNTAQSFFDKASVNISGVTGRINIHQCPAEGSGLDRWLGCKNDPRANYKEKTWP